MAWNQPSRPNNPGGRRPGQGGPDLDERLKSWQRRLEAWLRPGGRGGDSGSVFLIAALVVLRGRGVSRFFPGQQGPPGLIQPLGEPGGIQAPGGRWGRAWPIRPGTEG